MNVRTLPLLGISVLAFALSPGGGIAAPPAATPMSAALSNVLQQAVTRHDTPGAVGLVVDATQVLYEGAAGTADAAQESPLKVDAIFNIASMTKPVTSVAIMMLAEEGKLSIDDPVSKYLPGFDHLQILARFNETDGTYLTRPAKTVMTLRHLLTHTSGIGYAFSSPVMAKLLADSKKSEWEFPLLHEPGAHWTYGASTRVLGLIVEKLSGQTLEQFFQQRIFVPLGMVDTSYAVAPVKQSRIVTVFDHVDGRFKPEEKHEVPSSAAPPFRGDGGLYSTAADYGRFIRMFLNGGRLGKARLLSERSIRRMAENQIGAVFVSLQPVGMPHLTQPFPLGAEHDKFGLGFQISAGSDPAGRRPGSLSWAGLFNTEFWIDPSSRLGGVLLLQYLPFYDEAALRTLQQFEATVYRFAGPARALRGQ